MIIGYLDPWGNTLSIPKLFVTFFVCASNTWRIMGLSK